MRGTRGLASGCSTSAHRDAVPSGQAGKATGVAVYATGRLGIGSCVHWRPSRRDAGATSAEPITARCVHQPAARAVGAASRARTSAAPSRTDSAGQWRGWHWQEASGSGVCRRRGLLHRRHPLGPLRYTARRRLRTGGAGNPFFVTEIARLPSVDARAVPENVRAAICQRLSRLSQLTNQNPRRCFCDWRGVRASSGGGGTVGRWPGPVMTTRTPCSTAAVVGIA